MSSENKQTDKVEYLPPVTLSDLPEAMQQAASNAGWSKLMDVQQKSIPYFLANKDIMVQSRTGSGKTGAFALPALERVNREQRECQVLVLVPTRELARQVADEFQILSKGSGVSVAAVYGGTKYGAQTNQLKKGVHIVVGTPGRVLDHLMRKNLSLAGLQVLVFDEADHMLSMGFYPDVKKIGSFLPRSEFNGYLFSATYTPHVMRISKQFLHPDAPLLNLSGGEVHVSRAKHSLIKVDAMQKDRTLVRLIEKENPAGAFIFCNMKSTVRYVTTFLQRFGYDADELSADLTQSQREKVLGKIRKGSLRFLVATDVAARGIDIPELSHVIQFEPPDDPESYIHRAGRTSRAGASGTVITLADFGEVLQMKRIAKKFKFQLDAEDVPDAESTSNLVAQRMVVHLEAKLREKDKLQRERMERFVPLAKELMENEEFDLMAMMLDELYQDLLHKPVVPISEAEEQRRKAKNLPSGPPQKRKSGGPRGKKPKSDRGSRSGGEKSGPRNGGRSKKGGRGGQKKR